jgi:DHA1 family inner membrane transport protein
LAPLIHAVGEYQIRSYAMRFTEGYDPTMTSTDGDTLRSRNAAWQPAIVLIFAQMASGMRDISQFPFFLIYLQEQLGRSPVAISSVVAGAQIVGTVAALLGGAIAYRLGSKWVLVCGLILAGFSSLVFQVQAFWLVALFWLIGGGGAALVTVGGSSYLTRLNARGALGSISALYALSMTIGGAIGSPIAGVLIKQYGFGTLGWAAIALTVATTLIVALWMANLHNNATEPVALHMFGGSILSTIRQRKVRLLIGLRGLPTLFYGMLMLLIPLLINDLSGNKVIVAAYGTTTLIVASATQLLAGRAADRWGARRPTLIAYTAIIVSGLGLFLGAGSVEGLFIFGVLGIAAAWSLSTLMYVWVADGIPRDEHPSTFGLLHAVWSLCMIGGSMLGGWLVRLAPGLPFLVLGLINIGACALTIFYYRRTIVEDTARATQPI